MIERLIRKIDDIYFLPLDKATFLFYFSTITKGITYIYLFTYYTTLLSKAYDLHNCVIFMLYQVRGQNYLSVISMSNKLVQY